MRCSGESYYDDDGDDQCESSIRSCNFSVCLQMVYKAELKHQLSKELRARVDLPRARG